VSVDKLNGFDADADALSKPAMEDAKGDESNPSHHPFPAYQSYGAEYPSTYVYSLNNVSTANADWAISTRIQSD